MKTPKRTVLGFAAAIVVLLSLSAEAQAAGYLDSGAGSTVVQGLIASLATVARFFGKIKKIFGKAK